MLAQPRRLLPLVYAPTLSRGGRLIAAQMRGGVAGMSMWRMPIGAPERIDDRVDHRRAGTDGAGLARALDAERIGLARHVARLEHEVRRVGGARHARSP